MLQERLVGSVVLQHGKRLLIYTTAHTEREGI